MNRCPSCNQVTAEDVCPRCGVLTEPAPDLPPQPARVEPVPPPLRTPPPPPPSTPPPIPRAVTPAARPPLGEPRLSQSGQQQLAEYVEQGYEVFLIAGIAAAGKTQLLDAYRQDPYLSTFVKKQGLALPTSPDKLDCHPVSVGRRKVIFVDTSGEHFKRLYPELSATGEVTESEVEFLRLISRRLSGLVLLVDLEKLWNPNLQTNPEDEAQVRIFSWILTLLRWLDGGGAYDPASRIRFQDHVNAVVMRAKRRLRVPVLALFSRADELVDLPLPERPTHTWLRRHGNASRSLYPVGEDPLLLAHHCLPHLLQALETHAEHFRFDFVHSLVTDRDTGEVLDPTSCGVTLSLRWLLDGGWRWPSIPTRYWIAAQRFFDQHLKRNDRWERLPFPEEMS